MIEIDRYRPISDGNWVEIAPIGNTTQYQAVRVPINGRIGTCLQPKPPAGEDLHDPKHQAKTAKSKEQEIRDLLPDAQARLRYAQLLLSQNGHTEPEPQVLVVNGGPTAMQFLSRRRRRNRRVRSLPQGTPGVFGGRRPWGVDLEFDLAAPGGALEGVGPPSHGSGVTGAVDDLVVVAVGGVIPVIAVAAVVVVVVVEVRLVPHERRDETTRKRFSRDRIVDWGSEIGLSF
ncbi:hypothetical protein BHM03_00047227 [Ensete ventricosum]|nr:hypothetical protein BHM03_00047227 [Ensete ventricosum]